MQTPTILVVDDEQLIRWSLTERLKQEGYRVVEAETAAAAVERHAEGVDLVLLDYRLPDSDDLSLLASIRRILAGGLGSVSAEVRAAIKNILDDIDKQLKERTSALETKFRKQTPNALLAGLGLSPEQRRELRGRLSQRGQSGTVATGPNRSAFGFPVQPPRRRGQGIGGIGPESIRPIQINLNVSGKRLAQVILPELQKEQRRRSGSTRGPNAGVVLGAG